MNFSLIYKIYKREFFLVVLSSILLSVSSYLVFNSYWHFTSVQKYRNYLISQNRKIFQIKMVLSELERYRSYLNANFVTVNIDNKLSIFPFEDLISSLSSVYNNPGFFILRDFRLHTCLEKLTSEENCVPYAEIRGIKFITLKEKNER